MQWNVCVSTTEQVERLRSNDLITSLPVDESGSPAIRQKAA